MTLNNFEKRAKALLKKRAIAPKTGSWDKISAALGEEVSTSNNNNFWYGIAAGFIGLLLISVIYFKPTTNVVEDYKIVVSPDKGIDAGQEVTDERQELPMSPAPIKEEEVVTAIKREEIKQEILSKPENSAGKVAAIPTVEKELNKKVTPTYSEEIIDTKLEEVLARVNLLEGDKDVLTDAEVDSLLRQAQQELLADRFLRVDNSVDATALLSEVEDELDQSFRDQIFEKLKSGFNKVRTAVADRNN
ncbi:MAG: hypothetical protein KJN76_14220 [Eudoraea sp.]|nr:hypothetical protein [Eudoraea sp.]